MKQDAIILHQLSNEFKEKVININLLKPLTYANDNIANYTAITNLIDLVMLLMEKHEYGMGNKKFSHSITRNIDRKAVVKVGYITEFLNNSDDSFNF